ncbi:MAG: pyruvate dehydrogenase E1 component, partial [Gammaproteobacteria bacterium]|nr:pyruvate dehydrogenase E1 component [Gammaproteobacteria bacterium]
MNWLNELLQDDPDPVETREWIESIKAVIDADGAQRAHQLLEGMVELTRHAGAQLPFAPTTEYINTIPLQLEAKSPGDAAMEWRIRSIIRWNALAMVVRANRKPGDLGGHIASFASAATLYDVGFNHFWRAPHGDHPGDLLYIQGHSSPGIYARSFLEGRFTESQLDNFRMEVDGRGISSYPHPWLMPDYWQTPTVSMGLGPIAAIYQARNWKYLEGRGLMPKTDRKVWCFIGDGETDEPESLGAISVAGREGLDNLIFVVNCNLQRLDGPVRGNGKIIQELEGGFRGAGWNVLKVVWGSYWDPLLARDHTGTLRKLMMETVDGEYQNCKAFGGAYTREHFFGKYPETAALVANMSDQDIWRLNRGGHDPHKVYAAYDNAVKTTGQPSVVLAKTVKGYGMGAAGEALNPTHQTKKLDDEALRAFRDRFNIPVTDAQLADSAVPFFRQLGIYAPHGQKYKPVDRDQLMYYREDQAGQVLEEGITECGAFSSWMAAATSYSTNDLPLLPFYIYYSMFGFQRIGDSAWQAADMRARGFLLGATAGRTTLNGEGLQHEDGHSHLLAGAIPNCRAYDPTFAFEVAVILQHGMQRMLEEQRDEYFYITLMNENYAHPDMPPGAEAGIIKGMYLLQSSANTSPPGRGRNSEAVSGEGSAKRRSSTPHVQLLGSGTILRECIAAADLLDKDFGVTSDIWSCPSFTEL